MAARAEWRFFVLIGLLVIVLVTLPYLVAAGASTREYFFSGFLFNPFDGNSYLAKMYQGWQGNWLFRLPFSAERGEGAYLFLFYLGLGHLARIIGLPIVSLFHATRILSAVVLMWILWRFWGNVFEESHSRKLAYALSVLGSGMGWLVFPFGGFTADFWVAETFPFLSAYANPHFSLGLALVLWFVMPGGEFTPRRSDRIWSLVVSVVLGIINPFGVVVVLMVLGGVWCWDFCRSGGISNGFNFPKQVLGARLFWVALGGIPVVIYDVWATAKDPVLAAWNAQNLTPSPALWDLILSLSPALIFSVFSIWYFFLQIRRSSLGQNGNQSVSLRVLVVWLILGLIMLYVPVGLQRRFMMGLYVPVAGLATYGVEKLKKRRKNGVMILILALFILALPTNLMILMAANYGVQTHDLGIYLYQDEVDAMNWIKQNLPDDALILASPEMGLYIPAHTGRRVIYGHPFESVNAETEERLVEDFFVGNLNVQDAKSMLGSRQVDYIFFGPREKELGDQPLISEFVPAFDTGGVAIFRVDR